MPRKITQKEFEKKIKKAHGDKYEYITTVFNSSTQKIEAVCQTHGKFSHGIRAHVAGKGCPRCGYLRGRVKIRVSLKEFIKRSVKIHGNKYDYTNTVINLTSEKVGIVCRIHGQFKKTPHMHMLGVGCNECAREKTGKSRLKTTEIFIAEAKKVHNSIYDYSNTKYTRCGGKLTIICKEHGEFLQEANAHLMGSGCQACAFLKKVFNYKMIKGSDIKYSKTVPHNLYILNIKNETESFWKVGIAAVTKYRTTQIEKDTGYKAELIKNIEMSLYDSVKLEQTIHQKYKQFKHKPEIHFNGHTECYRVNPLDHFPELQNLNQQPEVLQGI
jgi:hypothetical protein